MKGIDLHKSMYIQNKRVTVDSLTNNYYTIFKMCSTYKKCFNLHAIQNVRNFSSKLYDTAVYRIKAIIKVHSIVDVVSLDLTSSISLASAPSSMSRNTSVSVSQVTGFFSLPVAHSLRISVLIRSAFCRYTSSRLRTLVPFESSRRWRPK